MRSGVARTLWVAAGALILFAVIVAFRSQQRSIQTVRTAKVERQDIHEGVVTNGKAEPINYREVRAEVEGEVASLAVHEGDKVTEGKALLDLGQGQMASELEQARADLVSAEEAVSLLEQGGTTAQIAELKAQLDNARRERDLASNEVQMDERLVEKGAVARADLDQSRARLAKAQSDLAALEAKSKRRYDLEEMTRVKARVAAASAAESLAEERQRSTHVTSPLNGTVYSLAVHAGDHVNRGDVLARVGDLSRIRVRVFVDEPDLGRVADAQPVLITWDGLPGRQWKGQVERLPSEVKEMGTRTVGEVACTVDNPAGELLPNTNLNVEIVTASKSGVLGLPREAVIGDDSRRFVYVVRHGALARQEVHTGILSATRAEIVQGLQAGDEVALASDVPLADGMKVRVSNE
jgi:HlyD family secretion protein